jgi:hypothetical protein
MLLFLVSFPSCSLRQSLVENWNLPTHQTWLATESLLSFRLWNYKRVYHTWLFFFLNEGSRARAQVPCVPYSISPAQCVLF